MNTTTADSKALPNALRLANALAYCDASVASQAAAELRSLHAAIEALKARAAPRAGADRFPLLPEPVAYSLGLAKHAHSSNIIAANEFTPDAEHADEWESLVTLDQAKAYADACVSVALRTRGAASQGSAA